MWEQTLYDIETFCPACGKEWTEATAVAELTSSAFVFTHCPYCGIGQMFKVKTIQTTQVIRDSEPELLFPDKEA